MLLKFYLKFDFDESLTFEKIEVSSLIEFFTPKLGRDKMRKILEKTGVHFDSGIVSLFKEG